jgi:hypothetical protein
LGYPPVLKSYVQNNDLSGFFTKEDWAAYFPELLEREDIVSEIIAENPTGKFYANEEDEEEAVVILKDGSKPPLTDNVHVGFKLAPATGCDKIFKEIGL